MFGYQPLVVYLCVSECICVSAHRLRFCSAHDERLIMKRLQVCQVQYCQQCVNFYYVEYHTANNASNFGGDPVIQLNVNVYQMKFIPQIRTYLPLLSTGWLHHAAKQLSLSATLHCPYQPYQSEQRNSPSSCFHTT